MWQASQILETFKTIRYISTGFELAVSPQFLSQVSFSWSPSFWLQLLLGPPLDLSLSPPPSLPPATYPSPFQYFCFIYEYVARIQMSDLFSACVTFPQRTCRCLTQGPAESEGKEGGDAGEKKRRQRILFFNCHYPVFIWPFRLPPSLQLLGPTLLSLCYMVASNWNPQRVL